MSGDWSSDVCSSDLETLVRETEVPVLAPCRDGDSGEIVAIVITNVSTSTNHVSPIHV